GTGDDAAAPRERQSRSPGNFVFAIEDDSGTIGPLYRPGLPRWANRHLPRCATSDSWRSLRSARVPPVRYRDKPEPTPERGHDWTPIRGQTSAPIDSRPLERHPIARTFLERGSVGRDRRLQPPGPALPRPHRL